MYYLVTMCPLVKSSARFVHREIHFVLSRVKSFVIMFGLFQQTKKILCYLSKLKEYCFYSLDIQSQPLTVTDWIMLFKFVYSY